MHGSVLKTVLSNDPRSRSNILLCFSHLRWNFVFQRPQHLLTRAAKTHQVIYLEEPVAGSDDQPFLRSSEPDESIRVLTPVFPQQVSPAEAVDLQRRLVDELLATAACDRLVAWYYTPMALQFSRQVSADLCVYDCMDELSAFRNAPAGLVALEQELFRRADVVFTGGQSLYEKKRALHNSIHAFPSSIDAAHFNQARLGLPDPADQAGIPHPRVGYFGVIDERLDVGLVAAAAAALPDVNFVIIGPVVKIDPVSLPRAKNLHWLGGKSYEDLPAYLANWACGWMPFALNEATRYISPTKTPEFLAAGLPVVSTAIIDVVRTYGAEGLVTIAGAGDISERLRSALASPREALISKVDAFLATMSWDATWEAMASHLSRAAALNSVVPLRKGA